MTADELQRDLLAWFAGGLGAIGPRPAGGWMSDPTQLAKSAREQLASALNALQSNAHVPQELMAVAVALTTQCPYCIEVHVKKARDAGGTDAELAETILVAAALRAGAALTHGTHCLGKE